MKRLLLFGLFASIIFYFPSSLLAQDNEGMGKTWVVFIENSSYQKFASIEGPAKDVEMMKTALSGYKIDRMVHKKNMTKTQLEQFFSTELKQLTTNNQVNSIMIWYAGHGKLINNISYWIPVDTERDNEVTYFDVSNLKSLMSAYSKNITHTLMVTDACESGPSFYQAMRDVSSSKSCEDGFGEMKSSQVFASSGYDLAADNSEFTQTFANTLKGNASTCLPMEKIVTEVTKNVIIKNQMRPKFGTIPGFTHEEGTFFFIKK